jgi:hypothetical protein
MEGQEHLDQLLVQVLADLELAQGQEHQELELVSDQELVLVLELE